MAKINDAAARAAAEAARRDAEARRAAEARARAAEAAKAAAARAKQSPSAAAKKLKADEFSTGKARALRVKSLALGTAAAELAQVRPSAPPAPTGVAARAGILGFPGIPGFPRPPAEPPPAGADQARADAERITDLAAEDPEEAIKELQDSFQSTDPAYREELLDHADEIMSAVAEGLDGDEDKVRETIEEIGDLTEIAGPEASAELGESFAEALEGTPVAFFTDFDGRKLPAGAGAEAFLEAALENPGMGDFINGMIAEAKRNEDGVMLASLGQLVTATTQFATEAFSNAADKVNQLNAELNALVQGFGPGDEEALQDAIDAFKERHAEEYEAFEEAGGALVNVITMAESVRGEDIGIDLAIPLTRALELAPQALGTQAGQEALGRALEGQARGEDSDLLDVVNRLAEDDPEVREQLGPVVMQAYAAKLTELQAAGRKEDAHALIDSFGDQAKLFGVDADDLEQYQDALHASLDGAPGASEKIELALKTLGPIFPEGSRAAETLKGVGFVVSLAGLGKTLEGLSSAELENQIGALASTIGLGADGAALAIKLFGNPATSNSLTSLFGKASTITGIVGATVGVIDFAQSLESGNLGDIGVSGLNAASGVLLLIPGGQIAGVGLAIASFALSTFLADRRQAEAEAASEADALAFLEAAGLDSDFAQVFANLDDNKRNIGTFVEEVASELGLSQDELFQKLNDASGEDREKLLQQFAQLSLIGEFGDNELPIFGPPPTFEDLKESGLGDFFSDDELRNIIDSVLERREELAELVAENIEPFLD